MAVIPSDPTGNGRAECAVSIGGLDDAYFGGISHEPGKQGRGIDQEPVIVGIGINHQGHPQYVFMEAGPNLTKGMILEVLDHRVDHGGVEQSDGAPVYAAGARGHGVDHEVTRGNDPEAPVVFYWINTVSSLAKTFIDGTYHGRGRARRQLYFEELAYRFNRRFLSTCIADRLLMACVASQPHLYAA